jgi:hypothetical protein
LATQPSFRQALLKALGRSFLTIAAEWRHLGASARLLGRAA